MSSKKQQWYRLGAVTKNSGTSPKTGKPYTITSLKFKDDVSIFRNGEELELNKYRNAIIQDVSESNTNKFVLKEIILNKEKIGEILKGKEGKPNYMKFDKDITFKIGNKVAKVNEDNVAYLGDPVKTIENLIKSGYIKEEEIEQKRAKAQENSKWLLYEVSMSPA